MSSFLKIGSGYYRQDDSGNLYPVVDRDTHKGLDSGSLPYTASANTRSLKFSDTSSMADDSNAARSLAFSSPKVNTSVQSAPPPMSSPKPSPAEVSETSAPTDLGGMLKTKLIEALTNYKGVGNTGDLEVRRQELLRKQMIAPSYSSDSEKVLTGEQKLALLRDRGSEYDPQIKSLEEQIAKAKAGDSSAVDNLMKIASAAKAVGIDIGGGTELKTSITEANGRRLLINSDTGETIKDLGTTKNDSGESGLSASQLAKVTTIAQQHDTNEIVKNYSTIQNKSGSMERILGSGVGGPGDLALVFEFMKALDPTSVVRETEYATAAKSGNIFAGVFSRFNGYLKEEGGFLPPSVQKAFISIMKTKLDIAKKQYDNYHSEQARKINHLTGDVDGEDYLTNYAGVEFGNVPTMIKVIRIKDNASGSIPESEFDPKIYKKK